jgi:vacuolar iron transporter family protein
MDRSASGPPPQTRLGRAVRAVGGGTVRGAPGGAARGVPGGAAGGAAGGGQDKAQHREQHRQSNWLRDVILGGQDGLVNILGIILGVIAGGGGKVVLLAAGFAAAITESISMGAVGWTSALSERDYYQAEQARESAEIDATPEAERQEIRDIYAAKGFAGDLLERVVETITANRDAWLATMMDEELHLQPVETPDIFRSAVVITGATLIGHLIPLLPFVWLSRTPALILAIVLSALVLFGVGSYEAVTLVGDWRKKGIQMVMIGLGAAAIGFLIGRLFHTAG